MKQIKFRAWDKEEKKMLLPEGQKIALVPMMDSWGITKLNGPKGRFDDDGLSWTDEDLIEGRYEPMQFTGLTDKNGKDIYEGDIAIYHNKYKFKVIWKDGGFGYYTNFESSGVGVKFVSLSSLHDLWCTNVKIMGNIYGNKGLLK